MDRLSVIERVIHHEVGHQPVEFSTIHTRELRGGGEYYSRRYTARDAFARLDTGWMENPGVVLLKNLEGSFTHVRPTPQEVEEAQRRVIEIAYIDSEYWFEIHPGDSLRIAPSHADKLSVRCQSGDAEFQLIAFPR